MAPTFKLIGLDYSPWTQRARWALTLCGVPYSYHEYTPGIGEPLLRWRMRKWSGPISVPVLLTSRGALSGSHAIVRFAAQVGDGARLGDLSAAEPWEALADAACSEGRSRVIERSLASHAVQREALQGVVPGWLQGQFLWLARRVMRDLSVKYGALARQGAMREALTAARASLGDGRYLLGAPSYADIALASCLQMVEPSALAPATHEAWSWRELATEFADIVAWRRALLDETFAHSVTKASV